ncbi:MAG: 30S ribosomal protein S14 [Chloroflexi bacterium]|nr:30S ribosomal protein S14 [Chloroflexota bacterium]MDA1296443.1 30S ribosomal protein S14 [Chloroflexota bacterium]
MAKKSSIEKNERKKRTVAKYAVERRELKTIAEDMSRSVEQRMQARQKLAMLPLDSSPVRVRNRCEITGRPRGYMRFFGLSRIAMRDLALKGQLPGIRKGNH